MLVEPRRHCPWSEDALIDAIIDLLAATRKFAPTAKYVSLISGQDWPLFETSEPVHRLLEGGRAGYMSAKALPADDLVDGGLPRMTRYWVPPRVRPYILRCNIQRVINRILPLRSLEGLPSLHYGSLWSDLRDDVVDHILSYIEQHPEYRQAFRWSFCADEIFFHSIVFNSPFANDISVVVDPDRCLFGRRFIDWARPAGPPPPPGHPRAFDSSDLSEARASGALFARKFDTLPE